MSDGDDKPLVRGVRRFARPVSWVRQAADRLIVGRIEAQANQWLRSLIDVENARRLQSTLAHIAQFGMELGFRADPDAARLYALVAWLEERHGRPPVLCRVAEHAVSTEATFLTALESIVDGYGEPRGSIAREEAARRMHQIRDVAAGELLGLLCALAELECGEESPTVSVEARVAFYAEAGLPDEFRSLGAMAAGIPGAFDPAREGRVPLDEERLEDDGLGALTRFVPSFDDPHLRFLTLSHLFFLQSYLTRNLVEALPELLQEAGRTDR